LRVVAVRPTAWVMLDMAIRTIGAGIAHGIVTLRTGEGFTMDQGFQRSLSARIGQASSG